MLTRNIWAIKTSTLGLIGDDQQSGCQKTCRVLQIFHENSTTARYWFITITAIKPHNSIIISPLVPQQKLFVSINHTLNYVVSHKFLGHVSMSWELHRFHPPPQSLNLAISFLNDSIFHFNMADGRTTHPLHVVGIWKHQYLWSIPGKELFKNIVIFHFPFQDMVKMCYLFQHFAIP